MRQASIANIAVEERPTWWRTVIAWFWRTSNYPLRPSFIRTTGFFWDTFGNVEAENTACWLVRFAKDRGGWVSFTQGDIDRYSKHSFHFNGLLDTGFIQQKGERTTGRYYFTHEFICLCYEHNPKRTEGK